MKRLQSVSLFRRACHLAVAACLCSAGPVLAQSWPSKSVRMIVPVGAGAAPDVIARLFAERLGQALKQAVIVDNKPGAGGIPGMSALARSPADGYTIGFVPAAMATITPLVYKQPQFDPDTDLRSVATLGVSPLVIVASAQAPFNSLKELAQHARAHPESANLAAPQMNSLPHLVVELANKQGTMRLTTVPYATAPAAITAMIAGEALVSADGVPSVLQHVKSGRLKALAVSSAQRVPGLDAPPAADSLAGFEIVGWFQVMVPAATPSTVVERLNAEILKIGQQPDYVARVIELGMQPVSHSPAAAREFLSAQRQVMRKLITELGVQSE